MVPGRGAAQFAVQRSSDDPVTPYAPKRKMSQPLSAAALKRLLEARMNDLPEVQEDGERVFANDVEWHEPDGSGRNWDMHGYRGTRGYSTEIRLLVDRMRREYRLGEEAETPPTEYSSNPHDAPV
jgi:hypothetical protein